MVSGKQFRSPDMRRGSIHEKQEPVRGAFIMLPLTCLELTFDQTRSFCRFCLNFSIIITKIALIYDV
ncbi:hypothetical protein GGR01_000722 [Acetobacter oeni]|nr:hypothetical protein [Acetobacter oeni]